MWSLVRREIVAFGPSRGEGGSRGEPSRQFCYMLIGSLRRWRRGSYLSGPAMGADHSSVPLPLAFVDGNVQMSGPCRHQQGAQQLLLNHQDHQHHRSPLFLLPLPPPPAPPSPFGAKPMPNWPGRTRRSPSTASAYLSSMLPLLSFHRPRRSSGRRHTNSSAAFTASSLASSCGDSSGGGDSSAAVMFRRQRRLRRFFASQSVESEKDSGEPRRKCCCFCSSRMAALLLMPLLPISVFLLTLFLLPVKQARPEGRSPLEEPLIRLPTDVVPTHYELHLKVYLPYRKGVDFGDRNFTVDGNLRLHLLCRQATNVLLLHAKALRIDHDKMVLWAEGRIGSREGPRLIEWKELAGGNDLLELRLDRALLPGRKYILEMGYRARIGRAQEGGLFQSVYTAEGGEKRFIAATQMQPLDARRLLPCFDEPNFKAEFSISVQHPEGINVLSNAPIEHARGVERGWTLSLFERTPKMATYLLALTVSDFQHRETSYKGIKIRTWIQPSKLDFTAHALNVTVRSLEYFEDYFGIPYPLKKLDIFGVPSLRVTAMENWGLIICRQQNLAFTEGVQAKRDQQFVTDVLAHEIAHMWFGDLVTMQWWDDLWLNEGFATIMGMKAADHVDNSTARTSQLFYEHTAKAFRFDQVANQAHALSYKISSVREVARRFDKITYLKAAAVLRMVERTVGEHLFKEGLRAFLRQFQYRNAQSDDLLRALSTVETNGHGRPLSLVNFSLSEFMDCWTYQTGFPLIRISPFNSTAVTAKQEQFFYVLPPVPNPSTWKLPLFMELGGRKETVWLFERGTAVLPRGHLVDPKAHGYYRIQYDPETYQQIICTLRHNFTAIEVPSRARLLEDAFTIARAGLLPFGLALEMSEYLVRETEYMPAFVFNNFLQMNLFLLLRNHPLANLLKEFIVEKLEPLYQRVFSGNSEEFPRSDMSNLLREFAMVQLCHWDYRPCVNRSMAEFAKVKMACRDRQLSDQGCNTISPELRGPVYSTAIRHGTPEDFAFLRKKLYVEEFETERNRIFTGLSYTTDIKAVNSLLNEMIARRMPLEDLSNFLFKFVKSPILNDIVLYMKANLRVFAKKTGSQLITKVVLTYVTKWMQTEHELEQLAQLKQEYAKELAEMQLLDYLRELNTEIHANMELVRKIAPQIFTYLKTRKQRNDDSEGQEEAAAKCQQLVV